MSRNIRSMLFAAVPSLLVAGVASADSITGNYLQVRHANVPADASVAVAVSQADTDRDCALLAWKVKQGTYRGTPLDGLAVVALVVADPTLDGGEKVVTRTKLLVDARANERQRAALVQMAKTLASDTIQMIATVKAENIDLTVCVGCAMGYALLDAGRVKVRTRRMFDTDNDSPGADHSTLANVYYEYSAFTFECCYSARSDNANTVQFRHKNLPTALVDGFSL